MAQIPAESQLVADQAAPAPDQTKAVAGHAYLSLLASRASFGCTLVGWHADGLGVDVQFHICEQLDPQATLHDFHLDFQLRATSRGLPVVDYKLLFTLEVDRYETLRSAVAERPRFMALLNLPADFNGCDALAAEELIAQRRGRWLCLAGAPQGPNVSSTPVRVPTWNVLTPAALREIARRVALGSRFFHEQ